MSNKGVDTLKKAASSSKLFIFFVVLLTAGNLYFVKDYAMAYSKKLREQNDAIESFSQWIHGYDSVKDVPAAFDKAFPDIEAIQDFTSLLSLIKFGQLDVAMKGMSVSTITAVGAKELGLAKIGLANQNGALRVSADSMQQLMQELPVLLNSRIVYYSSIKISTVSGRITADIYDFSILARAPKGEQ